MKELTSSEVRQMFLDFFQTKGHAIEPSASLIPVDDPTLLWINSGVATLKKYFDGTVVPENLRIVNAQKSIRTNDIENVGRTARHQTMFEMLGNFSLGDYFKKEALQWAWEFLTSPNWIGFDPERLYVTVYPKDEEAKRIWQDEIGLSSDHIIEMEDNFWDIGAGPSGPDTEIFYDRGQKFNDLSDDDPENYPGGENERYLEIWNLVFSEFNHKSDDTYEPLPNKNIDTGMGLERIVSVIQDAPTNFETDLFMPIIRDIQQISDRVKYGDNQDLDVSFRVIADHIRALAFAIADGALPSNEGRGYVLRRLLRRAVMHGQKLGINQSFLYRLVGTVGKIMSSYYPEVLQQQTFVEKVIKTEEQRFYETINEGMAILDQLLAKEKNEQSQMIQGADIFKLYDTYGFPVELTEEIASEAGFEVDHAGFEKEMQAQRERARNARNNEQSMKLQSSLLTEVNVASEYVGYTTLETESALVLIIQNEEFIDNISSGQAEVIFSQTPFYAELGGQVADTGVIIDQCGEVCAVVTDVQKAPKGQYLHQIDVKKNLQKGQTYTLQVDKTRHNSIIKNHTATHLLHKALKEVLGSQSNQAGSLVAPDYLRFDFSHFGQITAEELQEMEKIVNEKIWQALPVTTIETDIDTAKEMGAMALFGEKYGHDVRVVNIADWSIELCGGNHVKNTEDIGIFKITSESGIGAGVRRIEAVTSKNAYQQSVQQEDKLRQVAELFKLPKTDNVVDKAKQLQQELEQALKENEQLSNRIANQQAENVFQEVNYVNNISYVSAQVDVKDMNHLRQLADQWKQQKISDVLVLATENNGKANLLAAVTSEKNKEGIKAGDLIQAIAPKVGGGGGGRPDLAQAGGKKPEGIPQALNEVRQWLEG